MGIFVRFQIVPELAAMAGRSTGQANAPGYNGRMANRRQFSLAYLFLEIFWIAVTLGLLREAYRLYDRYRSFFDGWNSQDAELAFYLLVLAALFTSGTVIGGFFGRMRLGALLVLGILVQIAWMTFLWAVRQPAVQ